MKPTPARLWFGGQWRGACLIAALFLGINVSAAPAESAALSSLSFEELSQIQVVTASKHLEKLASTPAAVSVLTGEDVIRSGATSVAESLRWAPGLDVAQINAAEWAISARGFNGRFSNKLLVMVDGRTVYTPLLAGVYWDVVNPMLEVLDRIEIVRGPGGALWGANAVNGVINILTKSARDTQGSLLYGSVGTEKLVHVGVRQGVAFNDRTWMRVYASYDRVDDSLLADGTEAIDGLRTTQGGFRLDTEPGAGANRFTLQGDVYQGERERYSSLATTSGTVETDRSIEVNGFNLLGRWTREFSADSTLTLQTFWDHTYRDSISVQETRDTFVLDLQENWHAGEHHAVTCGVGYRLSADHTVDGPSGGYRPTDYSFRLFNGFVQDEITLIPDRLRGTLGVKLEHNSFTGFEYQPSARLLWTPSPRQTFWASVGRAVRTPNRTDDGADFNYQYVAPGPGRPLPLVVRALGSPEIESVNLIAWEAGWRIQPQPQFFADLSVFYNEYEDFILGIPDAAGTFVETSPAPIHLVTPVTLMNMANARSYGGELALVWQPTASLRFSPFYSYLKVDAWLDQPGPRELDSLTGSAPRHQGGLRTSIDLPRRIKFDLNLRWIGTVPAYKVPAYFEADVRVAWEVRPGVELVVTGQNLLDSSHNEMGPQTSEPRYELERGVQVELTNRF
ncbi:MAG: TonB-dependent receptor [Verrucomicrobia bacterium]|nr:TonB-dependent receptor [Verrucomicrobiota bacterium]